VGTDDKFKKDRARRKAREEKARDLRSSQWLIIGEGEKTEVNYFKGLIEYLNQGKSKQIDANVCGEGRNTKSLVKSVEKYFEYCDKQYRNARIPYANEQIILVFDKDSFSDCDFNSAIDKAEKRYPGCIVAWSNESFELWLCLHFQLIDTALLREQYNDTLTNILRKKGIFNNKQNYEKDGKNDPELFRKIIDCGGDMNLAMRRAEKLAETDLSSPAKANPVTMIYKAIEALQKEVE